MIKDNPLYKEHKDMFKKRFGLSYYLRKFVSYPSKESLAFLTIAFIAFAILSLIFLYKQQFFLSILTISTYVIITSCYIFQCFYLKKYHKDISLEKRKNIVKSVLNYIEQLKSQYDLEDDITREAIEFFERSQNFQFKNLLSDSENNIKTGLDYFFNDGDEYMFNFEYDIKEIDKRIAKHKQQQVSTIVEKCEKQRVKQRLSEVLYSQKIETANT